MEFRKSFSPHFFKSKEARSPVPLQYDTVMYLCLTGGRTSSFSLYSNDVRCTYVIVRSLEIYTPGALGITA